MTAECHPRWRLEDVPVDRLIYTTITLMSILIVYDGWATLTLAGVVAVIVGPMLAIFLGHVFGAGMGTRVQFGRPLTGAERRAVFVEESRFLLLLVPRRRRAGQRSDPASRVAVLGQPTRPDVVVHAVRAAGDQEQDRHHDREGDGADTENNGAQNSHQRRTESRALGIVPDGKSDAGEREADAREWRHLP